MSKLYQNGEENLRKNIYDIRNKSLKWELRNALQKIFEFIVLFFRRQARRSLIYQLEEKIRELQYQYKELLEEASYAQRQSKDYQKQVKDLMSNVDLDDIKELKVARDQLQTLINSINLFKPAFDEVYQIMMNFSLNKDILDYEKEFATALDNFQKIKIFRKYLVRFYKNDLSQDLIKKYFNEKNELNEKIKNVPEVKQVLEKLKKNTDTYQSIIRLNDEYFSNINQFKEMYDALKKDVK